MMRHLLHVPMKCHLCGMRGNKYGGAARDWTWFTGNMPSTLHFCPLCIAKRGEEIAELERCAYAPEGEQA